MEMKLLSMSLRNFKGFTEYEVYFGGNSASVFGRNETGKTTLFDAFTWLLFGKDSKGTKAFNPKPLNAVGEEIHNLETSVSAEFLLDDERRVSISHVMTENWVKQRGDVERTFKGHTHKYLINDVPETEASYNKYIASIVSQDVFMMITNPAAFNEQEWKKRRQMLLDISGVDADSALLQMPHYASIAEALAEKQTDIDGLRAMVKAKREKLNNELKLIPAKIAEVQRMNADMDDKAVSRAKKEREALLGEIEGIDRQIADQSAISDRYITQLKELSRMRADKSEMETQMTREANHARENALMDKIKLENRIRSLGSVDTSQARREAQRAIQRIWMAATKESVRFA